MSAYDAIARVYDPWSASVVEDVPFYVDEAVRSGGPVLELGVGTGRIAVPVAAAGIEVVGVDLSEGMLEVARERAALAGVSVDLRRGDMRSPPVDGLFPLVLCPVRSLLHMETELDRRNEETRTLILRLRSAEGETEMSLAWLSVPEWKELLRDEGFVVDAVYGWFDRSAWRGGEDSIWVCRRSLSA
jgi:SAM-dependent methyltransferase